MTALAQASELTRRFGGFTAVDTVSLSVEPGEVVGLLGANGAGKTTLIRLLLGLIRPSTGSVTLFGSAPSRSSRARVGYVPQSLGLYGDLSVEENWRFAAYAFDQSDLALPPALIPWRAALVGDLPLGLQRSVAFHVALAHRPELLVLDEPTSGVGPLAAVRLWEQIRADAETGTGVLVTTHNMEEAEQCDRLVIMVDGGVAVEGTVDEIIAGRTATVVSTDHWREAYAELERAGLEVQMNGLDLRIEADANEVERVLAGKGIGARVTSCGATLEEAFVTIVEHGSG